MSSETDMTFKILTIGESGVGKTCIAQRFVKDKFNKNHLATIGVDYFDKKLHINNKDIRLKIWDTAGQERFKTLTAQYYKGADGILLVYDVTDEESYEKIRDWMGQITLNTKKDDIGLVLLGNKCDIQQRKVTKGMGDKLGEELKIKYFETSALSGQGINESFEELARIIMKKRGIGEGNKGTCGVNLNKKQREEGCQCC
jgi:Ras-related protein Rab-8A